MLIHHSPCVIGKSQSPLNNPALVEGPIIRTLGFRFIIRVWGHLKVQRLGGGAAPKKKQKSCELQAVTKAI